MPFQHTSEKTDSTSVLLTYKTHDATTLYNGIRIVPTTVKDVSSFILDTAEGDDPDNQWDTITVEKMNLREGMITTGYL